MDPACCTCARLLSAVPHSAEASKSEQSEKPPTALPESRLLDCCGRMICGSCIHDNNRFAHYCPYCQISTGPSSLPSTGLKDPPSYGFATAASRLTIDHHTHTPPPPYSSSSSSATVATTRTPHEKGEKTSPSPTTNDESPILHFLDHPHDTVSSLSLRYRVQAADLRRANRLGSDHLLLGRRVVLIPATAAPGASPQTSLSPHPVEGEDQERRKGRIRRWMVACKEANYDVALLYLEQSEYDVDAAVEAYFADEAWEKTHPLRGRRRGGPETTSRVSTSSFASSSSATTFPAASLSAWPLASFGLGAWRR